MNRLSILSALPLFLVLASAGPGCLPDDPPVKGRLLYPGIQIEHPEFHTIDGETWVMFELRRRPTVKNGPGGILEVHLVNWDDPSRHRIVLPSRAERPEWPRTPDGAGGYFYMVNERLPEQGLRLAVGSLQRVRLDGTVVESIEDVMSYGALGGGRFFYRKHRPEARYPELHVRDLQGQDRNVGLLSGQVQFHPPERVYYIAGDEQTFTRADGFTGAPQKLLSGVSQFILHGSEKVAIVRVAHEGRQRTSILDLVTGTGRPLPVEDPVQWVELRGDTFTFSQAARADLPAELHFYDVFTGEHRKYQLPAGVPSAGSLAWRPPHFRDALVFDSLGGITVFRPEQAGAPFETTSLRPAAPSFTPDGRHLVFLEPEPPPPPPAVTNFPTGKLFAQSTEDWKSPPRQLSPKGSSVPVVPVGYRQRPDQPTFPLLFWARFGLGGSDLYLSNIDSGEYVKVAEGIGAVQVGDRHVLGIVRLSQDLTGDLVVRDFVDGREQMIETGVADMALGFHPMLGDVTAFVVRERRVESRRNGLWGAPLQPLAAPDPEMMAPAPRLVQESASTIVVRPEGATLVRPE